MQAMCAKRSVFVFANREGEKAEERREQRFAAVFDEGVVEGGENPSLV